MRTQSSALCADQLLGRDPAPVTLSVVVTAYPARYSPFWMKLLPSINKVTLGFGVNVFYETRFAGKQFISDFLAFTVWGVLFCR